MVEVVLGEAGAEQAWDDLTGLSLDAKMVKEARMKEIDMQRLRRCCERASSGRSLVGVNEHVEIDHNSGVI